MSRQELAEAVAAYLHEHAGRTFSIDAAYVAKLERGEHRWPSAHYRTAFRAVLDAATDAELGFFVIQGHANDPDVEPPASAEASAEAGEGDASGPTLLRALLVERHWQVYRTFRAYFLRTARELAAREDDPTVTRLDVSERQFQRWTHGARPRPDACRVLEAMFGHPIARLLGPAEAGATSTGGDAARPVAPVTDAGGPTLPDIAAGAAPVQVSVSAGAATSVTVVCHDGAPGRIAVLAGAVRVLIDASGADPADLAPPVPDAPAVAGGARVYSLAERRAR